MNTYKISKPCDWCKAKYGAWDNAQGCRECNINKFRGAAFFARAIYLRRKNPFSANNRVKKYIFYETLR